MTVDIKKLKIGDRLIVDDVITFPTNCHKRKMAIHRASLFKIHEVFFTGIGWRCEGNIIPSEWDDPTEFKCTKRIRVVKFRVKPDGKEMECLPEHCRKRRKGEK